ncbi:MAG: hypothetical protein M1324_00470 [Patescibacteria group bacterium]|nr:hypothetical protein [Patescibacteria group bacterium]
MSKQEKDQTLTIQAISDLMDKKFSVFGEEINKNVDKRFETFENKLNKNVDKKIEELARMVADGFQKVNEKFTETNEKIVESENRTKGIIRGEIRALEGTVNSNHGAMTSEFLKIHRRIDDLEEKTEQINQRTLKDEKVLFIDVDNIKKDVTLFGKYFKKLGFEVSLRKGIK